jgi:hypothetical protein
MKLKEAIYCQKGQRSRETGYYRARRRNVYREVTKVGKARLQGRTARASSDEEGKLSLLQRRRAMLEIFISG